MKERKISNLSVGGKNYSDRLRDLNQKILEAEKNNRSAYKLYEEQLKLLEEQYNELRGWIIREGKDNDLYFAELEIKLLSAMRYVAHKMGLFVNSYNKRIKKVQYRIFGNAWNRIKIKKVDDRSLREKLAAIYDDISLILRRLMYFLSLGRKK